MKILHVTLVFTLFSSQAITKESNLIKKTKYELTPETKGVLLIDGIPASGADIELVVGAMGETFTHISTTDNSGKFYFPEISKDKLLGPGVFDEQLVSVSIDTEYKGKSVKIWRTVTAGYDFKPFMLDNMTNLTCEIKSNLKYFIFSKDSNGSDDYEVHSICNLIGSTESGEY